MTRYVNVDLWGRRNRLPVDPEDRDVQHVFTSGQCHSFARALHAMTGWPLAVLCYDYDNEEHRVVSLEEAEGLNVSPWNDGDHVVCLRPDGMYVDVYGAWEPGERFDDLYVAVVMSDAQVRQLRWDRQNVRAAKPFAKALLPTVLAA